MSLVINVFKEFDVESIVNAYNFDPTVIEKIFNTSSVKDLERIKGNIMGFKSPFHSVVNIVTSINHHIEVKKEKVYFDEGLAAICLREYLGAYLKSLDSSIIEDKYSNKTLLEVIQEIGINKVIKLDKSSLSKILSRTSDDDLEEFVIYYDIIYIIDIIKVLVGV